MRKDDPIDSNSCLLKEDPKGKEFFRLNNQVHWLRNRKMSGNQLNWWFGTSYSKGLGNKSLPGTIPWMELVMCIRDHASYGQQTSSTSIFF